MKNLMYVFAIMGLSCGYVMEVRSDRVASNTRRFRLQRLKREWQECRDMTVVHVTQEGSTFQVVPIMPDDWQGRSDRRERHGRTFWLNRLVRIVR